MIIKVKWRRKKMNNYQAQIIKLKSQKKQLRLFLHELIEAFYKSVNKSEIQSGDQNQKEPSSP
jgi:hypothetical protein